MSITAIGLEIGLTPKNCGSLLKKYGFRTITGLPSDFSIRYNLCKISKKQTVKLSGELSEILFFQWKVVIRDFFVFLKHDDRLGSGVTLQEFVRFMQKKSSKFSTKNKTSFAEKQLQMSLFLENIA